MSLKKYLTEAELAAVQPVTGDDFDISIRDITNIETFVLEHTEGSITIALDEKAIKMLEHCGCTFEEDEEEQIDELAPVIGAVGGALARGAGALAKGAAKAVVGTGIKAAADKIDKKLFGPKPGEGDYEESINDIRRLSGIKSNEGIENWNMGITSIPRTEPFKLSKIVVKSKFGKTYTFDTEQEAKRHFGSNWDSKINNPEWRAANGWELDMNNTKPTDESKITKESADIVAQLIIENKIADFFPPFSANGLWVSDSRGNSVLEVTRHGAVAKEVANALNKYATGSKIDEDSNLFEQKLDEDIMSYLQSFGMMPAEQMANVKDVIKYVVAFLIAGYGKAAAEQVIKYTWSHIWKGIKAAYSKAKTAITGVKDATQKSEIWQEFGEEIKDVIKAHISDAIQSLNLTKKPGAEKTTEPAAGVRTGISANPLNNKFSSNIPMSKIESVEVDEGDVVAFKKPEIKGSMQNLHIAKKLAKDLYWYQMSSYYTDEENAYEQDIEQQLAKIGYSANTDSEDGHNVIITHNASGKQYHMGEDELLAEAEYQGRKVTLNKPMQGDRKKFKVYTKDPKTGNVKVVHFGDPNMRIKKSNPERRKSFRARHRCDNPGPKTKARYWSCRKW